MVSLEVPKGYEEFKKKHLKELKPLTDEHLKNEKEKVRGYVV